jgi:hypothetical protein
MKSSISLLSLSFLLIFSYKAIAQGEAAIPFLYQNPSPQFSGLGWTGVSLPNDDAFGFYYNPAQLGYFGQNHNLSFQTYPGSVNWFNFDQINLYGAAFNIGYNFKNELSGLNLSAGAGYIHSKFSYGTFIGPSGSYESYDSFDAYGFGAAIDYYVTVAIGITFKNIQSQLAEAYSKPLDANAIDYGLLLKFPVMDLFNNYIIELPNLTKLIPEFNYSLGYSRLNIGDEIYYVNPAQRDPLPLTARLGHTFNIGLGYESDDIFINVIDYDLILEADDILIDTESGEFSYQEMLGDIDFGKNLVQLKPDNNVVVHKGHEIKLVETIAILNGTFTGRASRGIKTDGLVISSVGLFKWLGSITENNVLQFIANHIELKYTSSTISYGPSLATDFSSLSVSLLNYSFN